MRTLLTSLFLCLWLGTSLAQRVRHTVQVNTAMMTSPISFMTAQYEYRLPNAKWGLGLYGARITTHSDGALRELAIGPRVRYHFMEYSKGRWDPYLGVGYSYARRTFQDPQPPTTHHGIKWQAGVGYFFTEHFALNFELGNVRYNSFGDIPTLGAIVRF